MQADNGIGSSHIGIIKYFFKIPVPPSALDLKPFKRGAWTKGGMFLGK